MTVADIPVDGRRVLVRVDFNVPMDAAGRITDDSRIRAALPTIRYLMDRCASVVLASHLGRPQGKPTAGLSLAPVAERLSTLLRRPVAIAPDSVGPAVEAMVDGLRPGDVLLLENLRFHSEEEANDPAFARALASLADVYVDDAFGTAHRAHASTAGVAAYLPAVAGFLMARELEALGSVLDNPVRPLIAIIGGAKISSKIGVLRRLMDVADRLLIGGGMANTLLAEQGFDVGRSLVEQDRFELAGDLLATANERGSPLGLPVDAVVAAEVAEGAESRTVDVSAVPAEWAIVDIGPRTVAEYSKALAGAGTVLWNGPMGVFEIPAFANGTVKMAEALANSGARTIVGGGDSVAAIELAGLAGRMTHVSTGGGASLEYLEGRALPGVSVLNLVEE